MSNQINLNPYKDSMQRVQELAHELKQIDQQMQELSVKRAEVRKELTQYVKVFQALDEAEKVGTK